MPPIFGIYRIDGKIPEQDMINRMSHGAKYAIPRKLKYLEFTGGWFAAAFKDGHIIIDDQEHVQNTKVDVNDDNKVFLKTGNYVIAADVSLYKREELLVRLGRLRKDISDHSISDAALVLESYLKWGGDCVQYLYGDYAFVIVNTQSGEIFCGRDPLGVRPLFYSFYKNCFVFASELKYVVQSYDRKPDINENYLIDTLVTVKSAKNISPFENIYRLSPGHTLSYNKGDIRLNAFWKPDPEMKMDRGKEIDPGTENQPGKEEEYIQAFREKLVDAVNMRCHGEGGVGTELSGGLDSSAVTGIAVDYSVLKNIPFGTFSNIFPDNTEIEFKDEREFINQMLEFRNMEWTGIDQLRQTIPELLQFAVEIQGCFIQQNFSILNQGIYEAAGEKGIDVLLSGFGGDEMVSARIAMPWNEIIDEKHWKILIDELFFKGLSGRTFLKTGKVFARYLYSLLYRPKYKTGVFTPELLDRRFANLPLQPAFVQIHGLKKRYVEKHRTPSARNISARQVDKIMQDHLPQRLEYCYAAAAQYGLEYRYPLLDIKLVETYLSCPIWLRQHHGINRYLFREAIKGFIPESVRSRDDKSGATIPQTFYSLSRERDPILSLIKNASTSAYLNSIFEFKRFHQWYDRLVKKDQNEMNYLMPGAFYHYLMMMLYYND
ncbi:MAG: hypothetical protein JXB19_03430 [Bacteroidales bacterium]|nr:hypothetical protein [Bacteroidales bacterium]